MKRKTWLSLLFGLGMALSVYPQSQIPPSEPLLLAISKEGGYFDRPFAVELTASAPATIYYTLDGNRPTSQSTRYTGPVPIQQTTTLRAVAYRGEQRSALLGHTYFIGEPPTQLFTVSISLPDWVLFDPKVGLFMAGTRAQDTLPSKPGANFWSRKEVFVHAEVFDPQGRCVHNSPMGLRLFGGMSRLFPQKSMALVARKRYGQKRIEYPLFGPGGLDKFKFIILRNSGSDWGKSHLRDAFMTGLTESWDIEQQDDQPAHVYINGRYWGIYHMREKINRYFLADHRDVDKDSLDLLEHQMTIKRGGRRHYLRLLRFFKSRDLSDPVNYAWVQGQMEVENFMDHQIAQIYFDNRDAGGNIRFWRPHRPGGRWRWILYDTDWGFGLHDPDAYAFNSLAFHTEPNGPHWPNPPWSTLMLRKLLGNDHFRRQFVNRFSDHLNTAFSSQRVLQQLGTHASRLRPELPRHWKRWRLSSHQWEEHLLRMQEFARQRPAYLRTFLRSHFDAGREREISIRHTKGGYVLLNDHLELRQSSFRGIYFENVPISLLAVADFGYRFSHWEGLRGSDDQHRLFIDLKEGPFHYKAVFKPFKHPLAGKLMINEIGPNNPNKRGGDWVELYNDSDEKVNLEGWFLTDLTHTFYFPNVTIGAKDYLVVCEDSSAFVKAFPQAYQVVGGLSFGINKRKESLCLYSNWSAGIDSTGYTLEPTDSLFSLSLLLPHLDNGDPENWIQKFSSFSPCAPNPYYVESRIRQRQEAWLQAGIAVVMLLIGVLVLRLRKQGAAGKS